MGYKRAVSLLLSMATFFIMAQASTVYATATSGQEIAETTEVQESETEETAAAVLKEVEVSYDLEVQALVVDWEGDNIVAVDIYQDDVLISQGLVAENFVTGMKLEPKSKHTYKVVPYNQNKVAGTEKSYVLAVDDYVAQLTKCNVVYDENLKQIRMDWEDEYTDYVTISLNEEELITNYKKKEFVYNYELQPGAAYKVYISPYNPNGQEGETEEADISIGFFEVTEEPTVSIASVDEKNSQGSYTGFSKPAIKLSWEAQAQAIYEIYRAEKNKQASYAWIATIRADKTDVYTYTDEKVNIGTYYYKVRRKIVADNFIYQELFTALSDESMAKVSVPKAKLAVQLEETGQIRLTMESDKQYVSGYDIYRKCDKGNFKKLATVTEDEYVDAAIEFGKTYCYKVKAYYYDTAKDKKYVGKASKVVKVKDTIGSMTAGIKAISADYIKLKWTPAANAKSYQIYRKSGTQGDSYVLYNETNKLSLKCKVAKNKNGSFMIRAIRENDDGADYFSSIEVAYKAGLSAPQGLKIKKTTYVDSNNTLIQKDTLSWNRVFGAKGYYVEVYNDATKSYNRIAQVKKGKKTSYTVSNSVVQEAKTLRYRISAYAGSKVKKGETIELTPQLAAPKGVKAAKSGVKVKLSWNAVSEAEAYRVYRSNGRTMLFIGETTKTTITDSGMSAGVTYNYYVEAVNNSLKITGQLSESVSCAITPKRVMKLTAVNTTAGNVQLAWNASKDAQKYIVYYKVSKEEEYQRLAEVTGKKTSYIHQKQEVGTECYYKVTAVQKNSGGIEVESIGTIVKVKIEK